MGLEYVVVEDYGVDLDNKQGVSPGDYGNFTMIWEQFSDKVKADGSKCLKGPIVLFMASNCSFSGFSFVFGIGYIETNTEDTKIEFVPGVVRLDHYKKGAEGKCFGMFINDTTGAPFVCNCGVEIDDANQDKVKLS